MDNYIQIEMLNYICTLFHQGMICQSTLELLTTYLQRAGESRRMHIDLQHITQIYSFSLLEVQVDHLSHIVILIETDLYILNCQTIYIHYFAGGNEVADFHAYYMRQ